MKNYYLAGDIGGTKTVLALFTPEDGPHQPIEEKIFPSAAYVSLEEIVHKFLKEQGVTVTGASFGVAGPVFDGRSEITNLTWVVDSRTISREIGGAPTEVLNDLFAIAQSIPYLAPSDLETLIPGEPLEHGTLGVIAPGTGLGEAFLVWTGGHYLPCPSEGGHASFGPETPLELELLNFLWPRFGHVSFERVCAGIGMANLYTFLRDGKGYAEPDWLRQQLVSVVDQTPVIVQNGLQNKAELCSKTLELFVTILGSEAGNLALKVLATGGIYLGGGIPPRILPILRKRLFRQAFTNKGRFAEMLNRVPVYVIRHKHAALLGVACHGMEPIWEASQS
jgi:glucokinase